MIPLAVQQLLRERAEERRWHAEELAAVRDECARDCKSMSERMGELEASEKHAYDELESAWKQYHEVCAQKEALHDVLVASMKR